MFYYDMDCQSEFVISLFGMMFFSGFSIGCLFLPALGDKNGRKKYFLGCIFINLIIFVIMLLLPNHQEKYMYVLIILMFFDGLQSGGRMTIGYCYMVEFAPENYHGMIGTVWDISESVVYIILTLYYRYVCKDWHYIILFASVE